MKLSLVVLATGKQEGKVIPIPLTQFVIGRDPQCHLRPASPLISKRHCVLLQRDGKAFVQDFGSTNGTAINDEPVQGEAELHHEDRLKVGPLLFMVRLEIDAPVNRATPKPPTKAAPSKAPPAAAGKAATPKTPPPPTKAPAPTGVPPKAAPPVPASSADDDIAAMLLSLQDDGSPAPMGGGDIPDGSTVMELILPPGVDPEGAKNEKDKDKPKGNAVGNTSNAAKSILEQYMRRPRG
jgi:predicted component of type VI protein secretion system